MTDDRRASEDSPDEVASGDPADERSDMVAIAPMLEEVRGASGSCLTDRTPSTLPNERDLAIALGTLDAANDSVCNLQWRVQRIARAATKDDYPEHGLVEGDEIPTFAHIGELYFFASEARSRLAEIEDFLNTFEEKIEDLNWVRRFHAGNPDSVYIERDAV